MSDDAESSPSQQKPNPVAVLLAVCVKVAEHAVSFGPPRQNIRLEEVREIVVVRLRILAAQGTGVGEPIRDFFSLVAGIAKAAGYVWVGEAAGSGVTMIKNEDALHSTRHTVYEGVCLFRKNYGLAEVNRAIAKLLGDNPETVLIKELLETLANLKSLATSESAEGKLFIS